MCHTLPVPRSLHVRLDAESDHALELLRAIPGVANDSEAVRRALRESADRLRLRSALRAEALALAADREDLAEMREIRELMDELAP